MYGKERICCPLSFEDRGQIFLASLSEPWSWPWLGRAGDLKNRPRCGKTDALLVQDRPRTSAPDTRSEGGEAAVGSYPLILPF
jgi:hypothetical protein